ncbi:hypothetical protein Acor_42620 [Acrocarpospora corrugata]|uniref:Uncharacterized protein n=1 Tax=Acrocarpospora corrugata TaxID=35763 RepID=A0A5M3VZA3_9ACTN|nr:hypothetical protein Acor_42620 [Acrocarpospora corrugata]
MLAAVTFGVTTGFGWFGATAGQAQAADGCARAVVTGLANKVANQVTAATGTVAGRNARSAVGTALVAVGRTGVLTVLPCGRDPQRAYQLAAIAGLPGLSTASGALGVADAAGLAAGSGLPALPGVDGLPDTEDMAAVPSVPGLADASALGSLPDLPGVPLFPGTPKSPMPNLVIAKGMPGELSGLAAGIPATSGLPEAPTTPDAPGVADTAGESPSLTSVLPKTPALEKAPEAVTEIAESLLSDTLVP